MGLQTLIDGAIAYTLTGPADLGEAMNTYSGWNKVQLESGTGSQQADRVYAKTITLAASATQSIELSGTLTDPIGGRTPTASSSATSPTASSARSATRRIR